MSGQDEFSKNLAKLEELLEKTKEATREGRELLQDMKQERKELREFRDNTKELIHLWMETGIDEAIKPVLQKSFADLTPQIKNLYNRVESQVALLTKPLEVAQPLIKQNEADIKAICYTLDKIEDSGILKMLMAILNAEKERRLTDPVEEIMKMLSPEEDVEVIRLNARTGDITQGTKWDSKEKKLKPK